MTNQPLTAEDVARRIWGYPHNNNILLKGLSDVEAVETYAAQQNAELVADHKKLHQAACDMIAEIKAENERLKQQLANKEPDQQAIDDVKLLRAALNKLARLGNGENYGNSVGNVMAQEALAATDRPEYKEEG